VGDARAPHAYVAVNTSVAWSKPLNVG